MRNRIASRLGRRPQPVPIAAGQHIDEIKTALAGVVQSAFDAGVATEKARVASILTAPKAAMFLDLAADLALGQATAAQAIGVLERTEADAAKRASLLKSLPLESGNSLTLH
jgi:hypothetical protein